MLSWLALILVLIVCTSVFLRYILGISSLGFDELQWHIYAFGFLMGFSYCTASDTHIRNDLLYNNFSNLTKLFIDLVSHLLVLLPFVIVVLYHSWTFVMRAYVGSEGSIDPGGLQYRWIIKSVLLFAFGCVVFVYVVFLFYDVYFYIYIYIVYNYMLSIIYS